MILHRNSCPNIKTATHSLLLGAEGVKTLSGYLRIHVCQRCYWSALVCERRPLSASIALRWMGSPDGCTSALASQDQPGKIQSHNISHDRSNSMKAFKMKYEV